MALLEGQVDINGVVVGPGTPYELVVFNPWRRQTRAEQGGSRAWNHGAWSGAEWREPIVVDIQLHYGSSTTEGWKQLNDDITAAFAPVGDGVVERELRFARGGREYLIRGRPRVFEPETRPGAKRSFAIATFVGLDPRVYDGVEFVSDPVPLPQQVAGVSVPTLSPMLASGTILGGRVDLLNEGTTAAPLFVRIDGPVDEPRFTLRRPDSSIQSVRFAGLILPAGQRIEVDTAASTALLNGLPGSSVFGQAVWDIDPYPLLKGTTELRFGAAEFNDQAVLTTRHRSAWW